MPFKIFEKPRKEKKIVRKRPLVELCKQFFPEDPEAMCYELQRLPTESTVYFPSMEEAIKRGEEEERKGNLKEAAELYRKAAGLAFREGSVEDVKKFLEKRKELLKKVPEEEKITLIDKLPYDTILSNVEASWIIMRRYLGLPESS